MPIMSFIGLALLLIGLWGILSRKHLVKMIIGFSIMNTGTHLLIVSLGYLRGRTAPIFASLEETGPGAAQRMVDPVPQALVLTAIVIGLAVTALMLSFAIRMYAERKSTSIDDFEETKW